MRGKPRYEKQQQGEARIAVVVGLNPAPERGLSPHEGGDVFGVSTIDTSIKIGRLRHPDAKLMLQDQVVLTPAVAAPE